MSKHEQASKQSIFNTFQSEFERIRANHAALAEQLSALDRELYRLVETAEYKLGPTFNASIADVIASNSNGLQLETIRNEWQAKTQELYSTNQHVSLASDFDLVAQQSASGGTCFN